LTRLLESATLIDRQERDGAAIHRFGRLDEQVLVIWSLGDQPASITLDTAGATRIERFDVVGTHMDVPPVADSLTLSATPSPQFIILRK
jgi:hypothetical protein